MTQQEEIMMSIEDPNTLLTKWKLILESVREPDESYTDCLEGLVESLADYRDSAIHRSERD